jgi:hypothetical protein
VHDVGVEHVRRDSVRGTPSTRATMLTPNVDRIGVCLSTGVTSRATASSVDVARSSAFHKRSRQAT